MIFFEPYQQSLYFKWPKNHNLFTIFSYLIQVGSIFDKFTNKTLEVCMRA